MFSSILYGPMFYLVVVTMRMELIYTITRAQVAIKVPNSQLELWVIEHSYENMFGSYNEQDKI